MKSLLRRLWEGEEGFIVSTELVLIATILVLGLVVGLSQISASVNEEMGDLAAAISVINQSFSFSGASGHHGVSGGNVYVDQSDQFDGVNCVETCTVGDVLQGS